MGSFDAWVHALEERHLHELQFREVSRALRALSSTYVERRHRMASGAALASAGKRAAFALFYAPLHYLFVDSVVRELGPRANPRPLLADLGCGTGASGAAWASAGSGRPRMLGIDRHPWAVREAAWTYRYFRLDGKAIVGDANTAPLPRGPASFLAAFTLNELRDDERRALLKKLLDRVAAGDSLLVVEPIATRVAPWWNEARAMVEHAGGRADEWRFRVPLPAIVRKLDDATGLHHEEITGRTLFAG